MQITTKITSLKAIAFSLLILSFVVSTNSELSEFLEISEKIGSNNNLKINDNYNDDSQNYDQGWNIIYPVLLNINLININFTPRIRFMLRDGTDVTNFFSVSFSNTKYMIQIPKSPYLKEFLVYFVNDYPEQNLISYLTAQGQLITKREDDYGTSTNTRTISFNWYNNSQQGRVKRFIYTGYVSITDFANWQNIGVLSNTLSYDNFQNN